jgi:hypothetical protein
MDESCTAPSLAHFQVPLEDGESPRAQHNSAILTCLRDVFIDAIDTRLGHAQNPVPAIIVRDDERDLL